MISISSTLVLVVSSFFVISSGMNFLVIIRLTIVTCTCIADEVYICDCSLTRTDDKQDDDVYYLTFLEVAIKDASRNNSENK